MIDELERFSTKLGVVRERAEKGGLRLDELAVLFGPKGHTVLSLFLIVPFLQPIPLPVISSIVGLTIAYLGFDMMLGRPVTIPQRFQSVVIESKILLKICTGFTVVMKKLEGFVKPRGRSLYRQTWFHRLNGFLIFFHALVLSLPLPIPFSNFMPSLVIFLISLAFLEEDIGTNMVAYVAVLLNAAFFVALVVIPYFSIKAMA